jgi:hypothetical protein
MSIRRSAFLALQTIGFQPLLVGRSGARLAAGEDSELSYALIMLGWKAWYAEELRLQHYMPPRRLTDSYATELFAGLGYSTAIEDLYLREVRLPSRLAALKSWPPTRWFIAFCKWQRHEICARLSLAQARQARIEASFFRGLLQGLWERGRLAGAVSERVALLRRAASAHSPDC